MERKDQSITLTTADLNAFAEIVANAVAKATDPIVAQLKDLNAEVRNILNEAAESNCQLEEINDHTQKSAWNTTDIMREVESIEESAYDLKRMARAFTDVRKIAKEIPAITAKLMDIGEDISDINQEADCILIASANILTEIKKHQ